MYKSSGAHLFRATTEIQSGPRAFDKSKFVMTFLTIFSVREVLGSFILVLEGKMAKEITESSRLEFLKKVFSKILLYEMQKITLPGN